MTYSINRKLSHVLQDIRRQLLEMCDTEMESLQEISRYIQAFSKEPDYNIAQYGNVLCYYSDIYQMYEDAGYKTTAKFSAEKIWETYKRQIGYVARQLMQESRM